VIRLLALGMAGVADSAVRILLASYLLGALGRARIVAGFFWFVSGDQGRAAGARTEQCPLGRSVDQLIADLQASSWLSCQNLHGVEP
jgi:hypothetical protein